jgi:hypothetical protein
MERLGVPAALLMTEPFERLVARFARTLGAEGYTGVMLPHPVATKGPEDLDKLADDITEPVLGQLQGHG